MEIGCGTDMDSTKKSTAMIEVKKMPKYYSSKLITRNQSGARLDKNESNNDLQENLMA